MAFHLLLFFGDLLATKLNEIDYKIYVVTALSKKKMMSTSKIKVKGSEVDANSSLIYRHNYTTHNGLCAQGLYQAVGVNISIELQIPL